MRDRRAASALGEVPRRDEPGQPGGNLTEHSPRARDYIRPSHRATKMADYRRSRSFPSRGEGPLAVGEPVVVPARLRVPEQVEVPRRRHDPSLPTAPPTTFTPARRPARPPSP